MSDASTAVVRPDPPRFRFRVADLIVWVFGVGVALAFVRDTWGLFSSPFSGGSRRLELIVALAGVWLGLVLAWQAIRLLSAGLGRPKSDRPPGWLALGWALLWRLRAMALLGAFEVDLSVPLALGDPGRRCPDRLAHAPPGEPDRLSRLDARQCRAHPGTLRRRVASSKRLNRRTSPDRPRSRRFSTEQRRVSTLGPAR